MSDSYTYFAWARGLYGTNLWNDLITNCCEDNDPSDCNFYNNENNQCQLACAKVDAVQWSIGLNPYSVYAECYGGVPNSRGVYKETTNKVEVLLPEMYSKNKQLLDQYIEFIETLGRQKNVTVRIPCSYTDDREIYLNRADVRQALHVPQNVQQWLPCGSLAYNRQYVDVRDEFLKVLQAGHRILAYFGDHDMACDHLSGMWFVESLSQTLLDEFKPWYYVDDMGYNQIAGFVTQYENLKFVSVKGAGHFVPTDKPIPSFIMWQKFLENQPY